MWSTWITSAQGAKYKTNLPLDGKRTPSKRLQYYSRTFPVISVLKNMIISWMVIRINQMLSRMNQIMTTLVKHQGRSSIPALTLWVSPLSIYMVLLNRVVLQLQKNKLDRAVEILKTSLSGACCEY